MIKSSPLDNALQLLDIQDSVSDDDVLGYIKRKYYEKALELHPDKKGSTEGFQNLQAAYELVLSSIQNNKTTFLEYLKNRGGKQTAAEPGKTKQSSDFQLYKKAVREYSEALENYFERVRQVNLNPDDPDYVTLCEKMKNIKKVFFSVVRLNPSGPWVGDCLDKIHRINIWLKNANYTSK